MVEQQTPLRGRLYDPRRVDNSLAIWKLPYFTVARF